ncbi:MAG: TA system VapC family ribonuclease toxin [bacterium]
MFVVDTNILVYAADRHSPSHARCQELLDGWYRQAAGWFLTWGICYEFLRVSTHPRVFRSPLSASEAWSFLQGVIASPGLSLLAPTDRHAAVLAEILLEIPDLSGNRMHDVHTAVLMREHGVRRVYTRDTHFHRFPFLDPVDPMSRPT